MSKRGMGMIFSFLWVGLFGMSLLAAVLTGASGLTAAVLAGAQKGITVSIGMAGAVCLWAGLGEIMEQAGLQKKLGKALLPLLSRIFPSMKTDGILAGFLSANFCANLLGLGNAATPAGIQAVKRLKKGDTATDQMCRLVVLNTASIQLIPATVAGLRGALGAEAPMDILGAVWITSFASAGAGLLAAYFLGKLWKE